MARGFSQKEGVDYDEKFSHVARYISIIEITSLTFILGWRLHHMDVNIVFLNGVTNEEVYIDHPECFLVHGKESRV